MTPYPTVSVVTLPDRPLEGTPLRPALWHASALLCAGYTATVSEYKHDSSGRQWRTWHISPTPIVPQADPYLAQGSDQLIGHHDCGRMAQENPTTSYLAAYYGARNLDILRCYVQVGGEAPLTIPLAPGRGPIACLVPREPGVEPIPAPGTSGTLRRPTSRLLPRLLRSDFRSTG